MLKVILPAAAALAFVGAIHADPPGHAKGDNLPPGLAKQNKVPPGHAKKMWKRGEALPLRYRDGRISDWERYDLRRAPDGYRWVRVDNEAYLIDVTSGIITEAVISAFN
ncbi:RcnB family protein [Henriciella sp. AS95]|uniref:RcnB family protein n=1 Tax=Henriciella sp. AS95 TaxID=3135782 RepID=UPI0031723AB8